jgi:hypothetical protein
MIGARHARRLASAAAMAGAALAGVPLAAQEAAAPAVHDRVRLHAPAAAPGTLRGEVVAARGDTLFVLPERGMVPVAVPLSEIERMDVRRRRSWLAGLAYGVLVGAPAGLGGGYMLGSIAEGDPTDCADDCGLLPVVGAATGLVGGTLLGALIGGVAPGGRWVRTSPRVHAAVGTGAVALSMSIEL